MTAIQTVVRGAPVAPVFEKPTQENPHQERSMRLRRSMWQELKAIARIEDRTVVSVVEHFLRWAIDDWRAATRESKRVAFPEVVEEIEAEEAAAEAEKAAKKAAAKRSPKSKK